jgi:hypothetical protein
LLIRAAKVRGACLSLVVLLAGAAALPAAEAPRAPLVPFHQGKKWGYADRAGTLVIPASFDEAERFEDGLARVARGEKWGVIDAAGREVVPLVWDMLKPFAEGFAPACGDTGIPTGVTEGVGKDKKSVNVLACGFIDRLGRVAVPLRYTGVNWVARGVAQVRIARPSRCLVEAEWGLVDTSGRELVPVGPCYVSPPSEDLIKVVYQETSLDLHAFGFHGLDGRVVIPMLPYDGSHERWSEGLMGVRKGGRFGFIDHTGHAVIPLVYDSAYPFSEGLAAVRTGGKWGFLDHAGKLAIAAEWDEVESFWQGLAWVRRDKSAGFVDAHGKLVVPLAFDGWIDRSWRPQWSEGVRAMKAIGGGWGLIDKSGRWVVPPEYDAAMTCSEGLCAMQKDKLWGFVDPAGKAVIPFRYTRLEGPFEDGLAFVSRRLRKDLPHFARGWIDRSGREFFDEPPLF